MEKRSFPLEGDRTGMANIGNAGRLRQTRHL
jgi:hypothetical protein